MFHILIVDDDKSIRYVLKEIVESSGYIAFTAAGGSEAFEILAKEHIDLAIVDIMMPGQNGYELTEEIRTSLFLWYRLRVCLRTESSASLRVLTTLCQSP